MDHGITAIVEIVREIPGRRFPEWSRVVSVRKAIDQMPVEFVPSEVTAQDQDMVFTLSCKGSTARLRRRRWRTEGGFHPACAHLVREMVSFASNQQKSPNSVA
jgi:hypothetical protein